MSDDRTKQCADFAAGRWADHLRTKPCLDNGDSSAGGWLTSVLASLALKR
jgi:hypothetical protein